MISKPFYLENLSAFDILIEDDREKAQQVIFRVYCIFQRDKIWLSEVATPEEITEEDTELLADIEAELLQLDAEYDFRFTDFYQRVQQEINKNKLGSANSAAKTDLEFTEEVAQDDDFFDEDDLFAENDFDFGDEDDFGDGEENALSHLSAEELDLVTDFILNSAKTRFNFPEFVQTFPQADEFLVEEEFILPLLAGKAYGEDDMEIAEKIHSAFTTQGFSIKFTDLLPLIEQKSRELGREILAFQIAVDSLQQGVHPTAVVSQIAPLLEA